MGLRSEFVLNNFFFICLSGRSGTKGPYLQLDKDVKVRGDAGKKEE